MCDISSKPKNFPFQKRSEVDENLILDLSKLAYAEGFEGDASPRTAAYSNSVTDSSAASLSKSPAEIEFRKKSNNDMPFMLYEYLNDFNWTMLELMAYEQEIEILWHSLQNNLCEIREQFIGE